MAKSRFAVIDIETTGSLPWKHDLVALGVGDLNGNVRVHKPEPGRKAVRKLLADPNVTVIAHTNYDLRWLVLDGAPFEVGHYHDTKVMAFLLDRVQAGGQDDNAVHFSLDALAERYLGVKGLHKPIKVTGEKSGEPIVWYDLNKAVLSEYRRDEVVRIEDVPWPEMEAYNRQDVEITAQLYPELVKALKAEKISRQFGGGSVWQKHFLRDEARISRLLIEMEVAGFPVDVKETKKWHDRFEAERDELAAELIERTGVPGFSLGSSDAIAAFLYEELPRFKVKFEVPALAGTKKDEREAIVRDMIPKGVKIDRIGTKFVYGTKVVEGRGLEPPRIKKGKNGKTPKRPSTKAEVLGVRYKDDPWVAAYLHWRSLQTLVNNFLRVWLRDQHEGRLHGRFDQSRAVTGRLANRDPNMQAIPSSMQWNVRQLFRPCTPRGRVIKNQLIIGDLNAQDVRIAAHWSQDPMMVDVFRRGADFYGTLCAETWGGPADKTNPNRGLMKILYLSVQYSARAGSVADKIRVAGIGEDKARNAQKLIDQMWDALPVLVEWRHRVEAEARVNGYVETITGRKIYLPDLYSNDWFLRSNAERMCVADTVQGSSADVMRRALATFRDEIGPEECYPIHQVHDEVLFQKGPGFRKDTIERIKECFERDNDFNLNVPMKFEIAEGTSWDDKGAEGSRSYRILERQV